MKKITFTLFFLYSLNLFAQYTDWRYFSKAVYGGFAQEGNVLWAGSNVGIMKIDMVTGIQTFFDETNSPAPISGTSQIVVDNNGNKWFGAGGKYLIKYNDTIWTVYDSLNCSLLNHSIRSLEVDNNNNLWIATGYANDGLIKFDGTNWTIYNTSNSSIPSDCIYNIFCEGNNTWLGTNIGLAKFDGISWTFYNTSNSNISSNTIMDIDKDNNGNIWLLHTNGVEKFNGSVFSIYNNSNTNIQNINNNSMTIDNNDIIWTGCGSYGLSPHILGGIMSFNGSTWTKYDSTNTNLPDEMIGSIYSDNNNEIWFNGSNVKLIGRKNGSVWTYYNPSQTGLSSGVKEIVFDQNGISYIGTGNSYTTGKGLVKFDWTNWTELDNYSANTWGITTDSFGNLYVKNPNELKKFDGTNWTTMSNTPNIQSVYGSSLRLYCIATDYSGGIWMDYLDRMEYVYNPSDGTWSYCPREGLAYYNGIIWSTFSNLTAPIPNVIINDIKIDVNNNVWLATDSGLIKYDGYNWIIYNSSNSTIPVNYIKSIAIDTAGNIWFSNYHYGFYKFDLTNTTNYQHPTLNSYISSGTLAADIDGSIWQTNFYKLIHFDGTNWTTFTLDNSPLQYVNSISIDKSGNKWVGTPNGFLIYKEGGIVMSLDPIIRPGISVSVYPNPFNEAFEIDFGTQANNVDISIYDLLGQKVYTTNYIQTQKIIIYLNNLNPGIYIYQLESNGRIISYGKVVAE